MREIANLLRHSEATAVIAFGAGKTPSRAEELVRLHANLPSLWHVIAAGSSTAGAEEFCRLQSCAEDAPSDAKADEPFLLLYTSGTTSAPKAVSVIYNHFLSNARLAAGEFALTSRRCASSYCRGRRFRRNCPQLSSTCCRTAR